MFCYPLEEESWPYQSKMGEKQADKLSYFEERKDVIEQVIDTNVEDYGRRVKIRGEHQISLDQFLLAWFTDGEKWMWKFVTM